jgi:hypothetical protein
MKRAGKNSYARRPIIIFSLEKQEENSNSYPRSENRKTSKVKRFNYGNPITGSS